MTASPCPGQCGSTAPKDDEPCKTCWERKRSRELRDEGFTLLGIAKILSISEKTVRLRLDPPQIKTCGDCGAQVAGKFKFCEPCGKGRRAEQQKEYNRRARANPDRRERENKRRVELAAKARAEASRNAPKRASDMLAKGATAQDIADALFKGNLRKADYLIGWLGNQANNSRAA